MPANEIVLPNDLSFPCNLIISVPPSFTSTPSDQIVNEKDQTTFTCIATGNPVPNITWSKDGKTVGTGDTLSFEASRNRSGIYWCSAENGIDESINTSVSLDVQCKLRDISNCRE